MANKKQNRGNSPRKSLSQEQRARRTQSILFSLIAGIMILSMIVALIAR
jgi:predicted nucleic acid-binding Zn ribbon protein